MEHARYRGNSDETDAIRAADAPAAPLPPALLDDTSAPPTPRTHAASVNLVALANQLDATAIAHLFAADPRVAAHVMAQGTLTSARNPSDAITAR